MSKKKIFEERLKEVNTELAKRNLPPLSRIGDSSREQFEILKFVNCYDVEECRNFFRVVTFLVRRPDGELGFYSYVFPKIRFGVCVAIILNGEFSVGVRQYRVAVEDLTFEVARGWLDPTRHGFSWEKYVSQEKTRLLDAYRLFSQENGSAIVEAHLCKEIPGLLGADGIVGRAETVHTGTFYENTGISQGIVSYFVVYALSNWPGQNTPQEILREKSSANGIKGIEVIVKRLAEMQQMIDDEQSMLAWMLARSYYPELFKNVPNYRALR